MRWKWRNKNCDAADNRIVEAEKKVSELAVRGERVAQSLEARLKRNHWGQTIAEIARGER